MSQAQPGGAERDSVAALRPSAPWFLWAALALIFAALRLPSLVEPTWYADEGTYADIGRALDHGAVLYQEIWDNKPPLIYWLAAAVIPVFGASGQVFHAVLAVLVGSAAAAMWVLGSRAGGRGVAWVGTLTLIVLAALPNLDGDLLNAEIVGAVLVTWAMVLVSWRRGGGPALFAAGVLAGLAMLTKGVFALDAGVLLAAAGLLARTGGAGWRRAWLGSVWLAGGSAAVVAVVVALLAAGGSLPGFVDVLLHQNVDYLQLTGGPGGHIVEARDSSTRWFFTGLILERTLPPLVLGGLGAWWAWRRSRPWVAVAALWLGADIAGAVTSGRGLTHYVQQAEPALALTAALLAGALWRRRGLGRPLAVLAVVGTLPVLQLCAYLPRLQVDAANHDVATPYERANFRLAQLGEYYALSYGRLTGRTAPSRYEAFFPGDLTRMRTVTALFRERSRPGQFVYVWGTVHWAYARSDRVPSGRYPSLNDAYYLDPGAEARLIAEVLARPPAVLIADADLPPRISEFLRAGGYRREAGAAAGVDAWFAPFATATTPAAAGGRP